MPSESLHDTPAPHPVSSGETAEPAADASASATKLPGELSEFNQRLASFGLGETPDPLLTESRPSGKRRPRR